MENDKQPVARTPEMVLQEFEEDTSSRWYQRAAKTGEAIALLKDAGREQERQHAIWEHALTLLDIERTRLPAGNGQSRFASRALLIDDKEIPYEQILSEDALDYFLRRADQTSNPLHRARYCEVLWAKRRDYAFALRTIDANLACLPIHWQNKWHAEAVVSLSKAIELALSMNDIPRIELTRQNLLQALGRLSGEDSHPAYDCLEVVDIMLRLGRRLPEEDVDIALNVCQQGITYYATPTEDYYTAREFVKRKIKLSRRLGNETAAKEAEIEMGQLFERDAESRGEKDNMTAATILEQAVRHYVSIGRSDKVEELKPMIRQKWQAATDNGEFGVIEVPLELPKAQIDEYAHDIAAHGLHEGLSIISRDLTLVPDIQRCRKEARELRQESPLLGHLPFITVSGDRQVAVTATEEKITDANALRFFAVDLIKCRVFLNRTFEVLIEKGLNTDLFVTHLEASPFFEKDKLELIRVGVERCFAEDYVSAVHVLVPHLEDSLRRVIGKLGVSTTSLGTDSLTREKPLDVVLGTPELKELLGDRVWFYFKYVLDHQLGENLRNDVAHGLVSHKRCTRELSETILHLFLRLTPFEKANPTVA